MRNTRQHELFRLSAILYADNNYEVSTQTIHKKIIESALLESSNNEMSVAKLIVFIDENYGILLSENEVETVINSPKNSSFEVRLKNGEKQLRLTKKRTINLEAKVSNSIGDFIKEYENIFKLNAEEIINKYLYELFQTNVSAFQYLFKPNSENANSISIDSPNFNEEQKDIINGFLNWDNPGKNKAIFDLSSLALEYCVLTNKKSNLGFINLRNKQFYLDTNILYRALGVNGEERRELTKSFLSKFNQVGEKLFISAITDKEFRDSIKYHVDNIRKHNNPRVDSKLYTEISVNEEIYNYFHKWRTNKVNSSTDLFLAHLLNGYQEIISEFLITIDNEYPFNPDNPEIKEWLKKTTSDIYSWKTENTGYNSASIDAENILWIETKREKKNININETVFFFISTDQLLRKWDYHRSSSIPIVMLPSQWLSILLRFVERSNDDYKSFVSFLNLRNNDILIEGEKLQIVLEGISEITTDIEAQRHLLGILVDNKFKDVIDDIRSNDEILERSKKFAKTETDKLLEHLKSREENLEHEVTHLSLKVDTQEEDKLLLLEANKQNLSNAKSLLADFVKKYNTLNKIERDRYVNKGIAKWRIFPYIMIVMSIVILGLIIFAIFDSQSECNLVIKSCKLIDNLQSDAFKNICYALYTAAILGIWGYTWKLCFAKFDKNKVRARRDELEREYESKEIDNA